MFVCLCVIEIRRKGGRSLGVWILFDFVVVWRRKGEVAWGKGGKGRLEGEFFLFFVFVCV